MHTTFRTRSRDLVLNSFICPRKNLVSWLSPRLCFDFVRRRILKECKRNSNVKFEKPNGEDLYRAKIRSETVRKEKAIAMQKDIEKQVKEESVRMAQRKEMQVLTCDSL